MTRPCIDCGVAVQQRESGPGRYKLRCDPCRRADALASRHGPKQRACLRCSTPLPLGGRRSHCASCMPPKARSTFRSQVATCPACLSRFDTTRPNQRFCSEWCRSNRRTARCLTPAQLETRRAHDRARRRHTTTTARGLGSEHQKMRAALLPKAYGCPCPLCGRVMLQGQALDLDHSLPRAFGGRVGDRITHARCNRGQGTAIKRQLQASGGGNQSRRW